MKRKSPVSIIICFILCGLIAGCGATADTSKEDKFVSSEKNMAGESDSKAEEPVKNNETTQKEDSIQGKESLAERMAGKYSYLDSGENGEELRTMEVINFGDNLYAYCANALPDDGGSFTIYDFWATEFVPYEADEIKSADGDSVEVNELRFSIMSNASQLWDSGHAGTITLTEEGLLFEGFDNDGFFVPEDGDSRLFLKDESVDDTFIYLKRDQNGGDKDLQGIWVAVDPDADLYIEFSGSDLFAYRKYTDAGVFLSAGGCDFRDGSFDCTGNSIWAGGMPFEFTADYKVEGDTLSFENLSTEAPQGFASGVSYHRITKGDVHVTTMDEVILNWQSFGPVGKEQGDPFDGVWVGAFKEKSDADALVVRLKDEGLKAFCVYSSDWENLNKDPYYCVTIGKNYMDQDTQYNLENAKEAGYNEAYVKNTGERIGHRVEYTVFDESKILISPTKAVLKDVSIYDYSDDNTGDGTLIVDGDTVFDESCDMQFFSYYEDGMAPIQWFKHINEIKDTEEYQAQGGALMGVFEVDITGNHVDKFYGSYWWD